MTKTQNFEDVESIIFCDESKFYLSDNNSENAIYYFGVATSTRNAPNVRDQLNDLLGSFRLRSKVFHSSDVFTNTRPRKDYMDALTHFIVGHKLHCFCFKYQTDLLYGPTLNLKYLNDGNVIDFTKREFQALFYFVTCLNTYLRDDRPFLIQKKVQMFFDRNVYGTHEIEAFNFLRDDFLMKAMTFVDKETLQALALPDFFGYIFRKAKISLNRGQAGDTALETSPLVLNCFESLDKIRRHGLFHFVDIDKYLPVIDYLLGIKVDYTKVM